MCEGVTTKEKQKYTAVKEKIIEVKKIGKIYMKITDFLRIVIKSTLSWA